MWVTGRSKIYIQRIIEWAKDSDNESDYNEIIKLIESGRLDVNEPIVEGYNLYHLALLNSNFTLIKYLCENTKVDFDAIAYNNADYDEVEFECFSPLDILIKRYKTYADLSIRDSSFLVNLDKSYQIIKFLLEKTNINTTVTTKDVPPYEQMIRYDSKLAAELLDKAPNTSKDKLINAVMLTCLKFGLTAGGNIEFNSTTLSSGEKSKGYSHKFDNHSTLIDPEGESKNFTVPDLQNSFKNYLKAAKSSEIDDKDKEILIQADKIIQNSILLLGLEDTVNMQECEKFMKKYHDGEPICLISSAEKHCAAVVLEQKVLYRCNKGLGKLPKYGIGFYHITDPNEITADALKNILTTIYPEKLETPHIEFQNDGIESKEQYVGNCTIASPKKAIHAIIYNIVLKEYPNKSFDEQKTIAKNCINNGRQEIDMSK